ncbi:MAG: type IX secretion system membrane protein PorP/SprF [Cyclobacteriaceae bacterium]|nr:type IX secretion system membrane protein PorP/SprF [Cyclobacteriaceae bacterium]MCK5370681.1 type IX secretion system membrane protein PorP/SprF [Cyclobacteriaceae bacterium]
MFVSGRKILVLIVLLAVVKPVLGQQDPHFSQYMFNDLYNNPAYSGVMGVTNLSILYRSQWLGYTGTYDEGGAPNSFIASFNTPIFRLRSGAGFYFVNDNIGPQNNIQFMGSYAYHLGVGNGKLSFGVRAGVYGQSIDFTKYRAVNPDDPLLLNGKESQYRPDMGVGFYYKAENYYGGVSLNHILKSEFDFGSDSLKNALENNMIINGGYRYELNYDIILTPSLLIKTDFVSYSFDISVLGTYREKFWGGLSYRQSEAIIALLGINLLKDKSLKIGYSLDYVIQAQKAKQATSHEILMGYNMAAVTGGGKKIIRTPRFRH